MSAPGAPSPAPRSASTGPNGPLPTPTGASAMNGTPITGPVSGGGPSSTGGTMSQQSLNQIVIDYLAKKGYTKTEAMLRAESSNQEISKDFDRPKPSLLGPPKYFETYGMLREWVDNALDIYKPELRRALWPIFVYCFLRLVALHYPAESGKFFKAYNEAFKQEHDVDLRSMEHLSLPEHLDDDNIGKLFMENRYRLVMSNAGYYNFMRFIEGLPEANMKIFMHIIQERLDLRHVDRASDDRYSFSAMLERNAEFQDMPAEDEGIPGHRPGNAISSTDPNIGNNLATLKLGKREMEKDLEADVRAEAEELDAANPPGPGHERYVDIHERVNIKQEEDDEGPTQTEIPYPPSTARDVAVEVQKIKEHHDRIKLVPGERTGGIAASVSVCMFTFHNTFDSINCIDFSGDVSLAAAGMQESYIRVWTMDGKAFPTTDNSGQPFNSRRLIGHAGPVHDVSFAPSSTQPSFAEAANTSPKWLLSCSADCTIRLWNLDAWQQIVVYKAHLGPVWSVQWGPFGHYFTSGGHDKTARIWTTDKIRPVRFLAGHDDDVDVVAWHPNSAYVFTGSCDKTVRMWAMTNGQPVRMFTGHTSPITAMACSPSGKILASADDNGWILLWDLGPGRLMKKMRGHGKGGIWSLSWSAESTTLTSGGADATVRVWDVFGPSKEVSGQKGIGEAGKLDGALVGSATVSGVPGKKKGREAVVTNDQISAFPTKATPVYKVKFTNTNLIIAAGAYLP